VWIDAVSVGERGEFMKAWKLILAQIIIGMIILIATDAMRFYSYITDGNFLCCSWYENDYLKYPFTNAALLFGEEKYTLSTNANKDELWIMKDVCFGSKCFWTIESRLKVK
jgi:hypothetical protein